MIEENILGLCINGMIDPTMTGLEEKHFSSYPNKQVWAVIQSLVTRKITPDVINVTEELPNDPTWHPYISSMSRDAVGSYAADSHIKKIKLKWRVRALKDIGSEITNSENHDINHFIKMLMNLNTTEKKYSHTFAEMGDDALQEVERVIEGESKPISTGLADIDKIMGGLHNSDLVIVAARSAMGKTAFLLNMVAANNDRPLLFSTEQSRIQAGFRFFSIYGNVPNHKIRTGDLDNEDFGRMSQAIPRMQDSNGIIYDKSGPFMSEIEAVAREHYHKSGITAIYLDYLQRIKHENPALPPHQAIGDIAMRLKELARELNIPVVALAQVSRKVEARDDKRPQMGDIKDSGTIEQEADSILTLYRDEVYNEDSSDRGTCEVNFKKNRHGGTGMVRVKWTAPTMKFDNLANMSF
ncbi:MAG: hypothetical protein GY920_21560 [Aliivibrio sp.]|nr:hypothetical protein [Aliivibrio sp.]